MNEYQNGNREEPRTYIYIYKKITSLQIKPKNLPIVGKRLLLQRDLVVGENLVAIESRGQGQP